MATATWANAQRSKRNTRDLPTPAATWLAFTTQTKPASVGGKNGYPEYFAKVINATNWIGISFKFNDEKLDLATAKVSDFERVLDMRTGILTRSFIAAMQNGVKVQVAAKRFCSMAEREVGVVEYECTVLDGEGDLQIEPFLDGDVLNEDSNYDMKFWEETKKHTGNNEAYLEMKTKKLDFYLGSAMKFYLYKNQKEMPFKGYEQLRKKYAGVVLKKSFEPGDVFKVEKLVANCTSRDYNTAEIEERCHDAIARAHSQGSAKLEADHVAQWTQTWKDCDIVIEGDVASQQAIRFNIFQLYQTYTGHDPRLNIGPKGFTGEKYGGSTYWDTEAYCLPFYMATTHQDVARTLLVYRYKHLPKAIENAEKLGFKDGAALYPMVTMNGEECHNEWEITFEEIHRNGAIAYAIYNYVNHTQDRVYLAEYGFEVLVGIARFWAQRVNWSEAKQQYVMLGVTGPNEYENNVNNNWYTNYLAAWCLRYTLEVGSVPEGIAQQRVQDPLPKTCIRSGEECRSVDAHFRQHALPEDGGRRCLFAAGRIFRQGKHHVRRSSAERAAAQSEMVVGPHPSFPLHQAGRCACRAFISSPIISAWRSSKPILTTTSRERSTNLRFLHASIPSSPANWATSIKPTTCSSARRDSTWTTTTARYTRDLHITSMAGTWIALGAGLRRHGPRG